MGIIGMVTNVSDTTIAKVFAAMPNELVTCKQLALQVGLSKSTVLRAMHSLVLDNKAERVNMQLVFNIDTGECYEVDRSQRTRKETLVKHLPAQFRKAAK